MTRPRPRPASIDRAAIRARPVRRALGAAIGAALALSLTACTADEFVDVLDAIVVELEGGPSSPATDAPGGSDGSGSTAVEGGLGADELEQARAELASLPVKGRAAMTGYERDAFGHGWIDVDRNGCDTRNDVLARDLDDPDRPAGCRVLSGVLDDPYTGALIEFVRGLGTSQLVQIDHVVPLANAWVTGAQQFTDEERVAFANDPLNLLAVDGSANQQKGAGDAATWLPSNRSFRCEYVARQVAVKAAHGLWVTPPERDAIERVLDGCRPAG
ncbi:HNH endonuclease family protein [Agromyces sp. SYSU T00266]|uniref:HNH endonuclease family protein n=1 Tax=Agromyces zhanjiangensis TaxID=3158562 RepID=UPI003394FDFB